MPIERDENGALVSGLVATGTTAARLAAAENCADWSSDAGAAALVTGDPTTGSVLWTAQYDGRLQRARARAVRRTVIFSRAEYDRKAGSTRFGGNRSPSIDRQQPSSRS